jgi:hypothetical protein
MHGYPCTVPYLEDKHKTVKASRQREHTTYKEKKIKLALDFSSEIIS